MSNIGYLSEDDKTIDRLNYGSNSGAGLNLRLSYQKASLVSPVGL